MVILINISNHCYVVAMWLLCKLQCVMQKYMNKPVLRIPKEPQVEENQTGSAHGGYKASFEACFVDIGCLEKHNFSTVLLENSRSVMAWSGSR